MNQIAELSKDLKKEYKPKKRNFKNPIKCWSEKDIINKKIVDTFVIIFNTRGCSWALKSGCSMCGYFNDSSFQNISEKDLLSQYKKAMERYNNEPFVKIFNSGSFLDKSEISEKVRNKILIDLKRKTKKISFESRPEYITKKTINEIKKIYEKKIEIGIGLGTADDYIRKNMINKGFTYKTYKKSVDILQKNDIDVKTYVLIKPPFLTEKESITDAINTVKKIKDVSNVFSFNPCNVQRNTVVEILWKKNKYRPPWLFSVVEILKESKRIVGNNARLKCDVAGGGSIRGAHNCRICDNNYLKEIANFSLNQNIDVFKNLSCECKEKWLDQIDIENLGFGSLVNMYG